MSYQAATHRQEKYGEEDDRMYARMSWRDSYWVIALIAFSIGVFSVLGSMVLDWAIHDIIRPLYASDILEGIVAVVLSGAVMVRMQSRRRELLVRMQIIEDVNHHVRNALTVVTLSSSLLQDPELNAQMRDACDRIDWVLNDVLSQTVGSEKINTTPPKWNSGRRLPASKRRLTQGQ